MLFLKNFMRVFVDLLRYCFIHRTIWPIPIFLLLVLLSFLIMSSVAVAPYIYALF